MSVVKNVLGNTPYIDYNTLNQCLGALIMCHIVMNMCYYLISVVETVVHKPGDE